MSDERSKIQTYEEAARVIHLYLKDYCDESLDYPAMIADSARVSSAEITKLKKKCEVLSEGLNNIKMSNTTSDPDWIIANDALAEAEAVG